MASSILRQVAIGAIAGLVFGSIGTSCVALVMNHLPPVSTLVDTGRARVAAVLETRPAPQAVRTPQPTPPTAKAPVQAAAPPSSVDETDGETVRGPVRLVDTATLAMGERMLPLLGLAPVDRAEARQAASEYLAAKGGVAECRRSGGAWSCTAGSQRQDVAEVLALSGLAVAGSQAGEAIRSAEAEARRAKRGIWSTF